jgi:hypothetical protein
MPLPKQRSSRSSSFRRTPSGNVRLPPPTTTGAGPDPQGDGGHAPSRRLLPQHPKGRIINHRPPNALDLEAVFEVALETGVALETNGLPDRLDLSGPEVRLAVEAGVPIVASTDAHSVRGLGNMELAIATARRGWATAADVVNTRPLTGLPRR